MRNAHPNQYQHPSTAALSSTNGRVATTLKRLAAAGFVLVLCANCGVFGSTSSFYTDNEVSPGNNFTAGVWDTDPPADPPAPQVDLSAPQSFSVVVGGGSDPSDPPPSDPPPGDSGDNASSTPPDDPPVTVDTDASSTPPVVQISDGTTTITTDTTGTDDASSTDPAPDDSGGQGN